tara:strand:+ start:271 stop:1371 length:1101 start_codon:yes stop_codon:yes gene_type:complete
MRIIFDYKIFYQQKVGGISNYFYNLGNELLNLNNNVKFICPIHKNKYLKLVKNENKKGLPIKFLPAKGLKIFENINHVLTNNFINNFEPNIVHETYYSKKNYEKKVKIVCTFYDMINEIFPKYFNNSAEITEIKKITAERADKILCISNKTKQDLIKYFNVDERKIQVSLLSSGFEKIKFVENKKKKFSDCILFVGSRHGYKNFESLIIAYGKSNYLKNNFRIISYGGEKLSKYELEIIKKNNIKIENILFFDDNDFDLPFLYSNVSILLYPSLYEGFGIPILEAMKLGCPVLSSNGGALKEVGGEGIEYFDPLNIDEISTKLEKILNSESLIKNIIDYGLKRSNEFSWKKCAEQTLKVYNNLQNE